MESSIRSTTPIPIPVADTVTVTLQDVDEKLARAFEDDTCVSVLNQFSMLYNHALK